MPALIAHRVRFSFLVKLGAALTLAALADRLFFMERVGATLGVFALAWAALLLVTVPAIRRSEPALYALSAAAMFGIVLIDDPSVLGWALFWISLSLAALLPRRERFDSAARWLVRLALHAASTIAALLADVRRVRRARATGPQLPIDRIVPVLALPVVGGALFVALFAVANPLIGNTLSAITLPQPTVVNIARALFWAAVLAAVWPMLRPRAFVTRDHFGAFERPLPSVPIASVTLSLIVFNAIFAVQNLLDIVFLWSGAPLPDGVTLAEYAHRGAYALIATALLAGLFVLAMLSPRSASARLPLVRQLVTLWVGQNLLLVASSMLRTLDYVDAYSLTRLRIAALAWMVLVAAGLVLICWRLLAGKSGTWLVNANAVAAAAMLALASVVDLGAVAAHWNVRHAREAGGRGAPLDLCYLGRLGPSALLPLIEIERGTADPAFRERVRWVRGHALDGLSQRQTDRHGWTWRGSRRLAAATSALGPNPRRAPELEWGRRCDGRPHKPPPAPVVWTAPLPAPAPTPLTGEAAR